MPIVRNEGIRALADILVGKSARSPGTSPADGVTITHLTFCLVVAPGNAIEGIQPGYPQQNGRHERMLGAPRAETACSSRANSMIFSKSSTTSGPMKPWT